MHGWVDDYSHVSADILIIEGEIHLDRKAGGMRFTSIKGRDDFTRDVLYGLRPIKRVRHLADKVHDRMRERAGGRMWMAGHMRRGDCELSSHAFELLFLSDPIVLLTDLFSVT